MKFIYPFSHFKCFQTLSSSGKHISKNEKKKKRISAKRKGLIQLKRAKHVNWKNRGNKKKKNRNQKSYQQFKTFIRESKFSFIITRTKKKKKKKNQTKTIFIDEIKSTGRNIEKKKRRKKMKLSLRKPININAISSFFHESFVRLFKSSPPSPRNDEFFSTTNGREKFSSNRDRSRADLAEKFNGGRGRKRVGGGRPVN